MTYWNGNGKYQSAYDTLSPNLVPSMGKCDTTEGELLRASSRIYYDFYNNGWGNNWSGALEFLRMNSLVTTDEYYALSYYACGRVLRGKDDSLATTIENISDRVIAHIVAKNGDYAPNKRDMFDFQKSDCYDDPDEEECEDGNYEW